METIITIERLGIYGEGVGHLEGLIVFVDNGLPGEEVAITFYEKKKSYARAQVVRWLKRSPHRVDPICPLFGRCGGCQIMHLEYAEQLKAKQERVRDALERIGKISDSEVKPCLPSPSPLVYRNKIQLPVREGFVLGLYATNSHDLVPVDHCYIHCELGQKAFQHVQKILRETPLEGLRFVLLKTAVQTHQVLIVLVTNRLTVPPSIVSQLREMPEIRGVVQNINDTAGNTVLGSDFQTLAGQGWVEEKLHGLVFKASAASFFQVNPAQAENLYQHVVSFLDLQGDEVVLDAYCGVGTLALILAQKAKAVIGIEFVPEAVQDAKENALRNKISNAKFLCGPAETLISQVGFADVAVLNPPRKGCDPAFLQQLCRLQLKKIVYVSCDPATLARDLKFLIENGFVLQYVQPLDMFPQTAHVETVVLLIKN
jgi:23S rRNA (uracil1939-C5)-methyltransferase